jgi:hypothetical protein
MGLFFSIFLPFMILWRGGRGVNMPAAGLPFAALGILLVVLFSLLQLLCNQFGSDRDGFRSLVLLPTARHRLLLGKNLALLPIVAMLAVVPLGVVVFWLKLSPAVALATVMQFAMATLLCCVTGNLFSILAPFRLAAGSLKPTKQTWQLILVGIAMHMIVFPVLAAFTFLPPLAGLLIGKLGWLPGGLVQFVAAFVLLVAFAALYWLTLPSLGRLLQRRETEILRAVTEVTE